MVLSPLWLLFAFSATLALRRKLHDRRVQAYVHTLQPSLAALCQPFSFFLLALGIYYIYLLVCFFTLMAESQWLNPEAFFRPPSASSSASAAAESFEGFEIGGFARAMCKLTPLCIAATFGVTLAHLWKHLRPRPELQFRWLPTFSHDLAMQIVAMPLVYGLFAQHSVLYSLAAMTGRAYRDDLAAHSRRHGGGRGPPTPAEEQAAWTRSIDLMSQAYSTNFELADLYEAWALRCFGLLCYTLVERQVRKEAPTAEYLIDTVVKHLSRVGEQDSRDVQVLRDLVLLRNSESLLFAPLRQTSRLGVQVFVYTCMAKSLYSLALTVVAEPPFNLPLCGASGVLPVACSLMPYADGAAMLASTLAIMNIIIFEHSMKNILGRDRFEPFWKFMAIKVLVSLNFIQSYLLDAVGMVVGLGPPQRRLLYACLVSLEVLPLSMFMFYAWRPRYQDWHEGDFQVAAFAAVPETALVPAAIGTSGSSVAALAAAAPPQMLPLGGRVQLADEVLGLRDDEFMQSRRPGGISARDVTSSWEFTGTLELRGDISGQEVSAIKQLVEVVSRNRIRATYKPTLYRGSRPSSVEEESPSVAWSSSWSSSHTRFASAGDRAAPAAATVAEASGSGAIGGLGGAVGGHEWPGGGGGGVRGSSVPMLHSSWSSASGSGLG